MKRREFVKIMLAPEGAGGAGAGAGTENTGAGAQNGTEQNSAGENNTAEDFDAKITTDPKFAAWLQSYSDKRVTQGIATAKARWEAEQAEAQTEAGKLAKMTEAEKAKYELDKQRAAFEQEKAKFQHEQLVLETAKQLTKAGLPDLAQYVTGANAEETAANIAAVTAVLGAWKQAALNDALRGTPPHDANSQSDNNGDKKTVPAFF